MSAFHHRCPLTEAKKHTLTRIVTSTHGGYNFDCPSAACLEMKKAVSKIEIACVRKRILGISVFFIFLNSVEYTWAKVRFPSNKACVPEEVWPRVVRFL